MESSSSFFLENTRGAASTASGRAKHPRRGRYLPLGLCPYQGTTSPLDPTLPPALFGSVMGRVNGARDGRANGASRFVSSRLGLSLVV
jgi:hypothetical protein